MMRLLAALATAAAFLSPSAAAAKKPKSTDIFTTYHAQSQAAGMPLKLDTTTFDALTAAPRNHSVAIIFTALEARFGCQVCQMFQPEWDLVARSWLRGDRKGESGLLFATLDFVDARTVFEKFGLQTAPNLLLFRPTVGPNAQPDDGPQKLDFAMGPQSAESVQGWLARHLPDDAPKPAVHRPFNWLRFLTLSLLTLGGLTGVVVAWPWVSPLLYNRNVWAGLSMIAILLFTSGHMFNHIRSVPYVAGDGKGGIQYFAPGFQAQMGMESQLVAALYGVLTFSTITLALRVPRMTDAKSQQIAVFVWGAVIFFVYSILLAVFRAKNMGYPFWLPPF